MRKLFLIGALGLTGAIAVVAAAAGYVLFGVGDDIASAVSDTGSRIFKTNVTVAETSVSLKSGDGQLIGVRIANPPGFSKQSAVHMPSIETRSAPRASDGNLIEIERAVIERPHLFLEIAGGVANIVRLRNSAAAVPAPNENDDATPRITIKTLILKDGSVTLSADFLGGHEIDAKLPDMRLRDIGAEDGATLPAVMQDVATLLVTASERALRRVDLAAAAEKLELPAPDVDLSSILSNEETPK